VIELALLYIAQLMVFIIPRQKFLMSAHSGLPKSYKALVADNLPKLEQRKSHKSVQSAHLRIYGICLSLAVCIFMALIQQNIFNADFASPYTTYDAIVKVLMAYLQLATCISLPLFVLLQSALQSKRTGKSIVACCKSFESLVQIPLFYFLILDLIPLVTLIQLSLGNAILSPDLATSFAMTAAIQAIYPLLIFGVLRNAHRTTTLLNLNIRNPVQYFRHGFSLRNLEYNLFLSNTTVDLHSLDSKPDSFVIKLTEIAAATGHMDKAEIISEYLVERQQSRTCSSPASSAAKIEPPNED
jgi:hypothetical protein